ncbi:unnamed protein product [Phaeothamnion confervicola]
MTSSFSAHEQHAHCSFHPDACSCRGVKQELKRAASQRKMVHFEGWKPDQGERERLKGRLLHHSPDDEEDDNALSHRRDAAMRFFYLRRARPAAAALGLLILTATASLLRTRSGSFLSLPTAQLYSVAAKGPLLSIVASNGEYPAVDTSPYPWKTIVEPHKATLLTAVGADELGTAGASLRWTVVPLPDEGESAADVAAAAEGGALVAIQGESTGAQVVVIFKQSARQYQVTVTSPAAADVSASNGAPGAIGGGNFSAGDNGSIAYEFSASKVSAVTATLAVVASTTVMCKYVRRELRQLSAADRGRFLDALEVVHRLPIEEGVRRYGNKFTNYEQQVAKHLGRMTLDGYSRFHNGQVFLTAHFAFSLELEQALQAVDPSVALPFWDYTIDGVLYGSDWADRSPVLTDEYLGAYPPSGAGALSTGRWAWLPIPSDNGGGGGGDGSFAPERNAYGRLTDSINPDPAEFVGRSRGMCGLATTAPLPACKELWGVLAADNMDRLQPRIEFGYHGMLHAAVGGYWDCPYDLGALAEARPAWAPILEAVGLMANTLWRGAAIRRGIDCPTRHCAAGDPVEECSCVCPWLDATPDAELSYSDAYMFLDATSAIQMLSSNPWLQGLAGMVDAAEFGIVLDSANDGGGAREGSGGGDDPRAVAGNDGGSNIDGTGAERRQSPPGGDAAVMTAAVASAPEAAAAGWREAAEFAAVADPAAARPGKGQRREMRQRRRRLIPNPNAPDPSATSTSADGGGGGTEVLWFYALSEGENTELVRWLARFVAHPGKMAPFATPLAAPNDPLFGPVHSNYLRLMGYMTLTGHLDTSWTDGEDGSGNGPRGGMAGHGADSRLPFWGLFRGDPPAPGGDGGGGFDGKGSGYTGGYTNRELVEMMDPANARLPYVWADFDWSHCPSDDIPDGDRAQAPPKGTRPGQ